MQLNDDTKDLNLRISPSLSPDLLPPDIQTRSKRTKKILSIFVGILILILLCTSTIYVLFSSELVSEYSKYRSAFLRYVLHQNSVETVNNKTRSFNTSNLSYFSDIELGKLGILSLPENFQIQETYKGIRFVRSPKKSFSDIQIRLLKQFVDKTPQKLLNPGPTAIVTYQKGEIKQGTNFNPNTAAFASGSYIFFNDESFNPTLPLADNSVDAAFSTYLHEMTHIAQFNEASKDLTPENIDESYVVGYTWIDLVLNSNLITEFAKYTNWQKTVIDKKPDYILNDKEAERTTDYGKSKIYEDMAETVAAICITNTTDISVGRQQWALEYLSETKENLKIGKFPFSEKYEQVNASNLQYDTSKENEMKSTHQYVDRQVFINQKLNQINDIENFMNAELNARGWNGKFVKSVESNNIIRFKGNFTNPERDMYIEIYSYDEATGFSIKPKGTIIVVINGYLKEF